MNRSVSVWVVPICVLPSIKPVLAAEERASVPASLVMRVYVAGTPATVARTSATVHELCSRLGLDVVVEPASDESILGEATGAWIKAFVDLRSSAPPRVVVIDAETHRELERRSLPSSASLEMSAEEAAHVLYVAAESALSAREARTEAGPAERRTEPSPAPPELPKIERPESAGRHGGTPERRREANRAASAPERDRATLDGSARAEAPARRSATRFQSDIRAFGSATTFGAAHASFGAGASVDGGVEIGMFRLAAALAGTEYFPSELTRGGLPASIAGESGRAALVGAWEATTAFVPFAALGGGVDRITVNASSPPPGASAAGAESRVDPMLEGVLGAKVRIWRSLGAFFAFATDVDLSPHRYVVDAGGVTQTFLDLSRIRPVAFVGLSVLVGGSERRTEAHR